MAGKAFTSVLPSETEEDLIFSLRRRWSREVNFLTTEAKNSRVEIVKQNGRLRCSDLTILCFLLSMRFPWKFLGAFLGYFANFTNKRKAVMYMMHDGTICFAFLEKWRKSKSKKNMIAGTAKVVHKWVLIKITISSWELDTSYLY